MVMQIVNRTEVYYGSDFIADIVVDHDSHNNVTFYAVNDDNKVIAKTKDVKHYQQILLSQIARAIKAV